MSSEVREDVALKVVDAFDLDEELRTILKPGEMVEDAEGRSHRLPRYFYEIPSHEFAMACQLTTHFGINEFILSDLREAPRLQQYPRYLPCAVRILAFYLEQFRLAAGASVHIPVNGGYRSPSHKLAHDATPHMWGTAADIYRIGSTILRTRESIEKYNTIAENLSDDLRVLPYGPIPGSSADDHVHLDVGYLTLVPREIRDDFAEQPQEHRPRFAFEERRRQDRRGERGEGRAPRGEDDDTPGNR